MDKIGLYKSFKIHDLKTTKSNQKIKFLLPNWSQSRRKYELL